MFLPWGGCSYSSVLLNHRYTIMWTVMSKALCCRTFYSPVSEYPCSSLISYQEFLQIAAISTHWPLSFPVARFRRCYLIGKHLKSTAGGGGRGRATEREKLKCGPHFALIYCNQYCDLFISTHFTVWQFSFYHVCTMTLVYASCPQSSFMHFEVVHKASVDLVSRSAFQAWLEHHVSGAAMETSGNCSLNLASWSVTSDWG